MERATPRSGPIQAQGGQAELPETQVFCLVALVVLAGCYYYWICIQLIVSHEACACLTAFCSGTFLLSA